MYHEIEQVNMYKPSNVMVTGGAGFIGSHFVDLLCETYPHYNVVIFDKLDYCASKKNINPESTLVTGDICRFEDVANALANHDIDTVVHFAAQSHVDTSFGNSLTFTHTNVFGTHVMLEAARSYGKIKRFIYVSTDEVYGDMSHGLGEGLHETSVLAPNNPYASSKAGAEMICRSYTMSYKMPIIITRGNNVYGPRQHTEKLIPCMVTRILDGESLPIHGEGDALRSYLYVSDVVNAFDKILHHGKDGETYNIGTDEERSVLNVVNDIVRVMGADKRHIEFVTDRKFQDKRYFVKSDKLNALGWYPQIDWQYGLQTTIKWYSSIDHDVYWQPKKGFRSWP